MTCQSIGNARCIVTRAPYTARMLDAPEAQIADAVIAWLEALPDHLCERVERPCFTPTGEPGEWSDGCVSMFLY